MMAEYPNCKSCKALCHAESMIFGECVPCVRKRVKDWGKILQALFSAEAHVHRQQFYGKHEQDREDAVEWLATYRKMMLKLRYGTRKLGWKKSKS